MRWHYMTRSCFMRSRKKGALYPRYHGPKERGLLWFCDQEIPAEIAGTVRIGVQAKTAPLHWQQAISQSRMGPYLADTLSRIAREQGTALCQWWATAAPVPKEHWCRVERWHDGRWQPVNIPEEMDREETALPD